MATDPKQNIPQDEPKDILLDRVPYEDMPYELLLHQEAQGDRKAIAEIKRRATVEVEQMLQKYLNDGKKKDGDSSSKS